MPAPATTSPFAFDGHPVRVELDASGEPWFVAKDVCDALGYGNPRQALESHVDGDDVQRMDTIDSLGRTQQTNHINESGVYSLIMGSRLESAKRFKRWVTSEVLPSIRRTGSYTKPVAAPSTSDALALAHALIAAEASNRALRADNA